MKGNIYAEKCSCGGKMVHYERRHNCFCSACGVPATKGYIVRFGAKISKRFNNYPQAAQFLTGLRFKESEGSLDPRDYRSDKPLSFVKQSEKWLSIKEKEVSKETHRKYTRFMRYANTEWKDRNVKSIGYSDLEDFLSSDRFKSGKYRHDAKSCLNHFFDWLVDREDIKKPKFPMISFELGWRNFTDLDTQQTIIDEVNRIVPQDKIAFGIELLASYTSLRPEDLRRLSEGDYNKGILTFRKPTKLKNKSKLVRLLPEHAEQWEKLKKQHPTFPQMPFFRHHKQNGVRNDSPYGKDLFYKWWKKACANLGIEGLDLYGGTRHTTTTAIAKMASEEMAKKASGHMTNKAFDRYCQTTNNAGYEMAKLVRQRPNTVKKMNKKE
jgi:integrase